MTKEEKSFLPKPEREDQRFISAIAPYSEYEVVVEYESGRLKWRKLYDFERQIIDVLSHINEGDS